MARSLQFRILEKEQVYYDCTIRVAKTKTLITGAPAHLVFAYAFCWFSYTAARIFSIYIHDELKKGPRELFLPFQGGFRKQNVNNILEGS